MNKQNSESLPKKKISKKQIRLLFLSAYCCRIFLFLLCSYFSGKARTRAYGNLHFPTAPLQFKEPPELAVSHSKDKSGRLPWTRRRN